MNFSTRELVTTAIFGTLWGVVEITLGGVLKALDIPMAGMFLSAIGVGIAIVGRLFVPKRGSTLFIGVIAMILKLFSLGGVIIGPMIGIFMEAVLAEVILSLRKKPSRLLVAAAGAAAVLWVVAQPFVTGPLIFGRSMFIVWLDFLDSASRTMGINSNALVLLLGVYILLHLATGALSGLMFWGIGQRVQSRLGSQRPNPITQQ